MKMILFLVLFPLASGCAGFYRVAHAPLADKTGNMGMFLVQSRGERVAFDALWHEVGDATDMKEVGPNLWVQCDEVSTQNLRGHVKARANQMQHELHRRFRGIEFSTWSFYSHTNVGGCEDVCVFYKINRCSPPPVNHSGDD